MIMFEPFYLPQRQAVNPRIEQGIKCQRGGKVFSQLLDESMARHGITCKEPVPAATTPTKSMSPIDAIFDMPRQAKKLVIELVVEHGLCQICSESECHERIIPFDEGLLDNTVELNLSKLLLNRS